MSCRRSCLWEKLLGVLFVDVGLPMHLPNSCIKHNALCNTASIG